MKNETEQLNATVLGSDVMSVFFFFFNTVRTQQYINPDLCDFSLVTSWRISNATA